MDVNSEIPLESAMIGMGRCPLWALLYIPLAFFIISGPAAQKEIILSITSSLVVHFPKGFFPLP